MTDSGEEQTGSPDVGEGGWRTAPVTRAGEQQRVRWALTGVGPILSVAGNTMNFVQQDSACGEPTAGLGEQRPPPLGARGFHSVDVAGAGFRSGGRGYEGGMSRASVTGGERLDGSRW